VPVDDVLLHRPQVFFDKTIIQHNTTLYPWQGQNGKGKGPEKPSDYAGPGQARRRMGASPPTAGTGLSAAIPHKPHEQFAPGFPLQSLARTSPLKGLNQRPLALARKLFNRERPLRGWRVSCGGERRFRRMIY
jgi:hypothetical protein